MSQDPGRYPNNTYHCDHLFLGCRWLWKIFPDTKRQEAQTTERKEQSRQNVKQWAVNDEPSALKISLKEVTDIDGNTTSSSINAIEANAQIRVNQDIDLVLKSMKLKVLSQPHDEVLMMTDSRFKNYQANEDRKDLKGGLLFRKNFGETGGLKYYQFFIP